MAEALTGVLVEHFATVLIQKIEQQVKLATDAKDEVKKLQRTFKTLQKVLKDAENREFRDESVKDWLDQFRDVAYDMEDVLDEWMTEIRRTNIEGPPDENDRRYKLIKEVSSYSCLPLSNCFTKAALYYDIGSRIKVIRETLDSICADQKQFEFTKSSTTTSEGTDDNSRRHTSAMDVDVSIIQGRDLEKKSILDRLLGESSSSTASNPIDNETYGPHNIISIIGMGGLGKTTLTQLIIHDDNVKNHFGKNIFWVCVSEPFDRTRIAKAIIHEAGGTPPDSPEWNALRVELCDSVKGKRFLLVLDDLWTDDENDLYPLKDLVRHGAPGSRIMVTTRNESVGKRMESYQHLLGTLSVDDCCLVLNRKALGTDRIEDKTLKEIGFEIAKKCKGLPLTASILGGLLRERKTESHWRSVLQNNLWELEEVEQNKLLKIMLLSYNGLSSPLKRCFAYCAIFPKDHRIKKHTLIKMWMAHGFLNSKKRKDLDSIGDEYFNALAHRSFFQDFAKDKFNDTISCKMHDLVHDFAQFVSNNEILIKQNSEETLLDDSSIPRHLTLTCTVDEAERSCFHTSISQAKKLRSLLVSTYSGKSSLRDSLSDIFQRLRCLRVLKLKKMGIEHLPSEIKELIHLRYLDLSSNVSLTELPDSVCSLNNLQTLKLKWCRKLEKLPREMERLSSLKHLDIRGAGGYNFFPKGIGKLTSLRTLSNFTVGDEASGGCKIEELKDLNLLEGCITISGLERLRNETEASEAELKEKQGLCCLNLDFGDLGGDEKAADDLKTTFEGVLRFLQPHPNLKKLRIENYLGRIFPTWMTNLVHLRSLTLEYCDESTQLPALGMLPSLEKLSLIGMDQLKCIGVEIYGYGGDSQCTREVAFPKLKKLLIDADNLEVWDMGDGEVTAGKIMPCVTTIDLRCAQLVVLPAALRILPSLNTLSIRGSRDIGPEFFGVGGDSALGGGGNVHLVSFPNLKTLEMFKIVGLEELDMGIDIEEGGTSIMPCLTHMSISSCHNLKTVRNLSKLQSLEELNFSDLDNLEYVSTTNLPCLMKLMIWNCPNLKSLQQLYLPKLTELYVFHCLSLSQLPPSPNLKELTINDSPIPEGLARLEKLQYLKFRQCESLNCILEEVGHLTALQILDIYNCAWPPDPNCIDQEGEDWSFISHIPKITINGVDILRADQPIHASVPDVPGDQPIHTMAVVQADHEPIQTMPDVQIAASGSLPIYRAKILLLCFFVCGVIHLLIKLISDFVRSS